MNLIYEKETYKILGACFEVYKQKGCGFTESVYQECLAIEFEIQKIPFTAQLKIQHKTIKKELGSWHKQ